MHAGTLFRGETLPNRTAAEDAREHGPQPAPGQDAAGPRVLVVEDNLQTQRHIEIFLRSQSTVASAGGYSEALAMVRLGRYDLVLMNINLGEERNGIDLLKVIRSLPGFRETPVVACTVYALPGEPEKLLKHGFDGYVSKSFTRATLVDTLLEMHHRG